MATYALQIEGPAAANRATPLAGHYVVEYRWLTPAEARATDEDAHTLVGNAPSLVGPCPLLLRTTTVLAEAQQFASTADALELWRRVAPAPHSRRWPDGAPNRPLTAYTVAVVPVP